MRIHNQVTSKHQLDHQKAPNWQKTSDTHFHSNSYLTKTVIVPTIPRKHINVLEETF